MTLPRLALLALVATTAASAQQHPGAIIAAHRGGIVEGVPENTLAAFEEAVRHGIRVLEIDLRATRDGVIVILHDETLDRTTNGAGPLHARTFSEIRQLDAGHGQRIPTFDEVLAFARQHNLHLLLDIKEGPGLDKRRTVEAIERAGMTLNVIAGPRNLDDLRAFQSLNPNLRTLGFIRAPEDIEPFAAAGVHLIRLWPRWLDADPTLIDRVHRLGKGVWVTAGDAPIGQLEALLRLGVNGILIDRPALFPALQHPRP